MAEPSTHDRILDTAEALLHRLGPGKMGVVDVARALGMSHANVYRHFASKAALVDAVVARWLHRVSAPLAAVAAGPEPAAVRLRAWLWALITLKRRKVRDDAELFATYSRLAEEIRGAVTSHVAELQNQVAGIIRDGIADGSFAPTDAHAAAGAVILATQPFHHPRFLLEGAQPTDAEIETTIGLLLRGLAARPSCLTEKGLSDFSRL